MLGNLLGSSPFRFANCQARTLSLSFSLSSLATTSPRASRSDEPQAQQQVQIDDLVQPKSTTPHPYPPLTLLRSSLPRQPLDPQKKEEV